MASNIYNKHKFFKLWCQEIIKIYISKKNLVFFCLFLSSFLSSFWSQNTIFETQKLRERYEDLKKFLFKKIIQK